MAVNAKPTHHHFMPPISIDMSSLTHSELHSLSLLSSDTISNSSSAATTTTTAASSKFYINPSLSTHQQTYSLSPHPRRHRFSLLNKERFESNLIVTLLKKHLHFDDSTPDEKPPKKKREGENENENATVEIVNRNGVVVDLAALEESENDGGPFAEELRKRAGERVKQEELLEVLAAMEGEWCSRRKKRRVVDASSLGDALPVGWKLIIALRRKGGHFFPYCRRYISPTGEQLLSCKEVSSYLQSYFGINDVQLVRDSRVESQQLQTVDSVNDRQLMCINYGDGNFMLDLSNSPIHSACASMEHEMEASILGIENLPDVCHMFTLHQKTTKRYTLDLPVEDKVVIKDGKSETQKKKKKRRLGSSVSDGVIMKDGKYECQFCHKVFEERRRYLGHVGNHVKGSIKTPKDLLDQLNGHTRALCMESSPPGMSNSRMDALVEVAQNSIQEIGGPVFEKEISSVDNVDQLSVPEKSQSTVLKSKENSSSCHNGLNAGKHYSEGNKISGKLYPCNLVGRMSSACPNGTATGKAFEEGKLSSIELYPPCNRVNEMSMTNSNAKHLDPCFSKRGGVDIGVEEIPSLELNPQAKMGEIPRTDENINVPTDCPDVHEIQKDARKDETLSMEINPLAKRRKMSTTDGEINWQSSTCNIVASEKNSCSEMPMTPAALSSFAENVRCNSTTADDMASADNPNIHGLWYNEKASDLDSSGKLTQLDVHKAEPELAQKYDSTDLVTVSATNHMSDCAMLPPVPQIPLNSSSTFDEIFEKAGQDICSLDQNLESVGGLEYLKLDVIEPQMYKYNGMSREDTISFYEVSMDMGNDIELGLGVDDDSLKSQSEFPQEMAHSHRCLTTTVCVWCGVEFAHEITDIEPQPDSVGFMCPACRAKISKQFNELESNFSLSSHLF
ncbi:uncharacterized protein [Spinacia oleracea]|uniref:Uncharacterized protein isoform X2 n=1 Tax=Spinacia oleracea TaxID=3562 RepID=A0A9R0JKI1_SPIOL|nr:uncharacterized protein LOC110777701 isoform X2 [Spinacia oleracea]